MPDDLIVLLLGGGMTLAGLLLVWVGVIRAVRRNGGSILGGWLALGLGLFLVLLGVTTGILPWSY